ncbi:importin beta-like protein Kap120p [[Candida] railenensis]|uniref:Importin beta-like protein Kap120p n=1 Tax=[Candida] railenensis TaxID=45579 RepID=A0A9P0QT19_9ASCO|nr:importin beta-like protein Kap120p [[Candida] railenensis]
MNLSYENLLNLLSIANGSERSSEQQQAEIQLKAWEVESGYHYLLQEIYLKEELPLQIRWLAVICFKNGIDKYWRSSRANAISKEEKVQIKSRLFLMVGEKNNQLAIQNAHSIARIARFDFPQDWPTIFDSISQMLEESVFTKNDLVATNNLLIILNQIIKTVSIVRVGRARHALQSKAPVIAPVLIKLYVKFFQQWTTVAFDLGTMQICYMCLKNLRRLIPEGYETPHKSPEIIEFLTLTKQHLQELIIEHEKYASSDMLERYVRCYCKLYVNLINSNPTSFILLPNSQDILSTFMSLLDQRAKEIYNAEGGGDSNSFWETLALKGFLILKRVIGYIYKRGAVMLRARNDKEEIQQAISKLTTNFFTKDVIQHLCDLIINWYLRLRPSDLESWSIEPEEWCNEEISSSSWEFQIRPCAENFFQDLISFFNHELSDFVISKIQQGLADSNDMLTKDAILCTFQLSSISIANRVDFNKILNDILIPEGLKNDVSENRIIKRRICLIINEWVSVDCSKESKVSIFRLLVNFLQPDNKLNDSVVKLTAIQCLKNVLDDYDFNKYDFQPFLNEFINLSVRFLKEVEYTESKLFIFNVLALLIYRCNPLVDHQTLIDILSVVPSYWESVQNEHETILKNSLLRVLKNLVVSLNANSNETYKISIPLVESCCDGQQSSDNYSLLSEDGYELWLSMLQYAPFENPNTNELLNLFPLIPYGLVNSTEILPIILSLVRSYALISPSLFDIKSEITVEIFAQLTKYLPTMRDDSFVVFVSMMDILLLEKSSDEGFIQLLVTSGLFQAMVNYILNEDERGSHDIISSNKIFLILSRLNPSSLLYLLTNLSVNYDNLFNVWMEYFNNNGNPRNKKINLLSLISLCEKVIASGGNEIPVLVAKFPEIVKKTLLFLEEVNETDDGNCNVYSQDLVYEDIDDYRYLDQDIEPHGEKKRYQRLLESRDPVYSTNLREYLSKTFKDLKGKLNGNDFNMLVSMNDEYTIEKLQQLIN